ncbi:hypothetical protein BC835DRAFT_1271920 [Cytidiella melzeri]|nr:hypothetical protein BC835DRAFT_1271920 [Cytidiella melzeri]
MSTPPPQLDVDVPVRSSRSSPGHFVKHSSNVTLLLSDQHHGRKVPEYSNGGIIDGIIAVPRPSGLLALEIVVEGTMKLNEIAGSGSSQTDILKDSLFTWDATREASFPTKVTFRYSLPSHYTHAGSGERFRLPPTYEAHLSGIPGFKVEVSYAVVVYIARNRDKLDWWRRKSSLRVPFRYVEHSRPPVAGPFPQNPAPHASLPKTSFNWIMKSRRSSRYNIKVTLYLPTSQICSLKSPIPFYVTLAGDEDALAPFSSYRPSLGSFHPLSSPSGSSGSLPQQIMTRAIEMSPPVDIRVNRHTAVDVLAATTFNLREKTQMSSTKVIGKGVIQSNSRRVGSITWSGVIVISPRVRCSGFRAKGIKVADFIALRIIPSDASRVGLVDCSETVPIRLATEPYDCSSAAVTVSSNG